MRIKWRHQCIRRAERDIGAREGRDRGARIEWIEVLEREEIEVLGAQ